MFAAMAGAYLGGAYYSALQFGFAYGLASKYQTSNKKLSKDKQLFRRFF
jgi:hypothetical protein